MPQAVTAIFGGESNQLAAEFKRIEAMAAVSGRNIQSNVAGTTAGFSTGVGSLQGHGGRGGVIGETVVLLRELGRGNYARVPGSLSILGQRMGLLKYLIKDNAIAAQELTLAMEKQALRAANVAKWTTAEAVAARAAYEAEGTNVVISLAEVDAKEAAAVSARVHAEAMTEEAAASRAAGAAAGFSLGPIGWLAIALAALGAAAWFTFKHFRNLATEVKNLAGLMNPFKKSFTEEAKAMQEDAKAAQDFKHWLQELNSEHLTEIELMEGKLKFLQDEARERRELMKLRGATAEQLNRFDIDQLKIKRDMLTLEKLRTARELEDAEFDAQTAQNNLTSNPKNAAGVSLRDAKRVADNAGKILDVVQEAMAKATVEHWTGKWSQPGPHGEMFKIFEQRPAGESDVLSGLKVGSDKISAMSVAQAKSAFDSATKAADELETLEKQLVDTLADTKKTAKEKADALKKIGGEIKTVEEQLGLKSGLGVAIARAEDAKKELGKGERGFGLNAQQSMGAYATTPPDFRRLVDAAVRTAMNTEHLKPQSHNPVGSHSTQHGSAWHTVWKRQ